MTIDEALALINQDGWVVESAKHLRKHGRIPVKTAYLKGDHLVIDYSYGKLSIANNGNMEVETRGKPEIEQIFIQFPVHPNGIPKKLKDDGSQRSTHFSVHAIFENASAKKQNETSAKAESENKTKRLFEEKRTRCAEALKQRLDEAGNKRVSLVAAKDNILLLEFENGYKLFIECWFE